MISRRIAKFIAKPVQRWELPAALFLLAGAVVTFFGVLLHLIDVGEFRLATLLVSADLVVSGASALQEATDDEDE